MDKKSREPKYYNCPCGRRLKLNGVRVPRHKNLATDRICMTSGLYIPEVKKRKEENEKTQV